MPEVVSLNSRWTTSHGLKINKEKVLPFVITSANGYIFKSSQVGPFSYDLSVP